MKDSQMFHKAREIVLRAKKKKNSDEERYQQAIELAAFMLEEANNIQTASEKKIQTQLARMMSDHKGKVFTTDMTDQCFRSYNASRIADQLIHLIQLYGVPSYLSFDKKVRLYAFKFLGKLIPSVLIPLAKRLLRQETSRVILPGESELLAEHMRLRRKQGVRINLNHLGEAILGEEEACRRLQVYIDDLSKPDVEYISVKVSTICSQINLLAWENTLGILSDRLKQLYHIASQNVFHREDGTEVPKFVNLDMEEYRDFHLTVELFCRVLDKKEFLNHSAGIVLQAYIPDSYEELKRLTEWAKMRVKKGGAPIKVRIVKGANLSMEKVEAALHGWPQAPYHVKGDVDSNFKKMITYGCRPENAQAVHLGIGSHNLFDIAYAMLLCSENHVEDQVCFEMLEGMADPMRRVVQKLTRDILLYCPAATAEDFQNAVAYLVRRLDENTAPQNFLRHFFGLKPGSIEWDHQTRMFLMSCKRMDEVQTVPNRKQNRYDPVERQPEDQPFYNEPDTDWSLPHNRKWAEEIIGKWKNWKGITIPFVICGRNMKSDRLVDGFDPSIPGRVPYRYYLATKSDADQAVLTAKNATVPDLKERLKKISKAAYLLRQRSNELIGAMVSDVGKIVEEADREISEAIDFAEYYKKSMLDLIGIESIRWKPKGTVLVTPPWNFSCAIAFGCVVAALVTGNRVIFKPAREAILVGWLLANILWDAGFSKEVLQLFICEDDPVGSRLIQNPEIDLVMLTGSTETAKQFFKLKPGLDLIAETGGKNPIIVTDLSDKDLAISDIVYSAFMYSGQKCSACSLLICESNVYDDPSFRRQLRDAVSSLRIGSAWDLATRINPLIKEANPLLMRGLTNLEEGEEWLLEPKQDRENPRLWSPGIKLGVREWSFTYQNELFGPVLAVMRANDLEHAIKLANGTRYGLTSGLHSLDGREQALWQKKIKAGNCYINRGITGAIVQRQPFGGCKESSFGQGLKAGGPNYLIQLMHAENVQGKQVPTYADTYTNYFSHDQDLSLLLGQDNILRYVPREKMVLRIQEGDCEEEVNRCIEAAQVVGTPLEVSRDSEEKFIEKILQGEFKRVRLLSEPSNPLKLALADQACRVIKGPAILNGRIELLHYLREVSISIDYHRYGNLGNRENEQRAPIR